MKINNLETRGTAELLILLREKNQRPMELIEAISCSADSFYKIVKILQKYGLIKKVYNEKRDCLSWSLTDKGKKIADLLNEVEKNL